MKAMKDFVENAEARGSVANPCCSEDEAIGILRDEIWGGVFVTKEVFDRFDWRDHIGLSKSSSCRVVHGMNESEDVAEPYRDYAPGEDIDPSDIAAVRAMLSGGLQ